MVRDVYFWYFIHLYVSGVKMLICHSIKKLYFFCATYKLYRFKKKRYHRKKIWKMLLFLYKKLKNSTLGFLSVYQLCWTARTASVPHSPTPAYIYIYIYILKSCCPPCRNRISNLCMNVIYNAHKCKNSRTSEIKIFILISREKQKISTLQMFALEMVYIPFSRHLCF